jgi:hypothetical protein
LLFFTEKFLLSKKYESRRFQGLPPEENAVSILGGLHASLEAFSVK